MWTSLAVQASASSENDRTRWQWLRESVGRVADGSCLRIWDWIHTLVSECRVKILSLWR